MKSKVYFAASQASGFRENKLNKIKKLYEALEAGQVFKKRDLVAVKLHFGERGNDSFMKPVFVRQIVDLIKEGGGKPFLTDTSTLYLGSRKNAADHLETALMHGFSYATVNAPILIADGLKGENYKEVAINLPHFEKAYIAGAIEEADSMIVMSHFKGHGQAGFGGAIKNLAMGCANPRGKKEQHSTRPVADKAKCIGCGECVKVCPEAAILLVDGKAIIDSSKCIGCGECMLVCPTKAIVLNWSEELKDFTEKLVEYAYAAVKNKKDKVVYFNFLLNITPECDCVSWSGSYIAPDIGILASTDPVAIDQASLDLINKGGQDIFKELRQETMGEIQVNYGQEIGLGSKEYELIKI